MLKKTLILTGMFATFLTIILCLVGWGGVITAEKIHRQQEKEILAEKLREVRIIAVKEKAPEPQRKSSSAKPKRVHKTRITRQDVKKQEKKQLETKKSVKIVQHKPEASASPPRQTSAARLPLDQNMIELGRKVINTNASVPIVLASYDQIGFQSYIRRMKNLGGRLYIGDAEAQEILAEVLVSDYSGRLSFDGVNESRKYELDGMALFRPREISGEPLVDEALDYAKRVYGKRDLRCVVLLPLDKEAAILGALKKYLDCTPYKVSEFDLVWGNYEHSSSEFALRLEKGHLYDSDRIVNLNILLVM